MDISSAPGSRTWWNGWLGADEDSTGTWTVHEPRRYSAFGVAGELQTITLRSFGGELGAELFRPDGAVEGPLIVVPFYETATVFGRSSARTDGSQLWPRAHGLHLAQHGFCVLAVPWWFELEAAKRQPSACQSLSERYGPAAESHDRRYSNTALGRSVADLKLAVSAVLSEGLGASEHIAAFGHSLGAKLALHLTALDTRVALAAVHEPGLGFAHSNWSAPWYLGARLPSGRDHDDLIRLINPRPLLLAGGGASDGAHNWELIERAFAGAPTHNRTATLYHNTGHSLPLYVIAAIRSWLAEQLDRHSQDER